MCNYGVVPAAKRKRKAARDKQANRDAMVRIFNNQPARFATYKDAHDRTNPIYFGIEGYDEAIWEESYITSPKFYYGKNPFAPKPSNASS